MNLRALALPVVVAVSVGLAGCSAEEQEGMSPASAEACAYALRLIDSTEAVLGDEIDADTGDRMQPLIDRLQEAAQKADGETADLISDAADELQRWSDRGLPLENDGIPVYVDFAVVQLQWGCEPDEVE